MSDELSPAGKRVLGLISLSLNIAAAVAAWSHDGLGLGALLLASFGVNHLAAKLDPERKSPEGVSVLMMILAYVGVFDSAWLAAPIGLFGCVVANVFFAVSMRATHE